MKPPNLTIILVSVSTLIGMAWAHGPSSDHLNFHAIDYKLEMIQMTPTNQTNPVNKPITYNLVLLVNNTAIPYKDIAITHGRKIHIVMTSQFGQFFSHFHPADFSNIQDDQTAFPIQVTFPQSGLYVFGFDFQHIQSHAHDIVLNVAKHVFKQTVDQKPTLAPNPQFKRDSSFLDSMFVRGVPFQNNDPNNQIYVHAVDFNESVSSEKPGDTEHVIHARMQANKGLPFASGDCVPLMFTFLAAKDNSPITDFELFLHAPAHFMIYRAELDVIVHTHGRIPMKDMNVDIKAANGHSEMFSTAGMNMEMGSLVTGSQKMCGPMNMSEHGDPGAFGNKVFV